MSICGNPGDMGNSMGVGKYCNAASDCMGLAASLCSTLGNKMTHFCTEFCKTDGGATQCGDMASCITQGNFTVCVPDSCIPGNDGGAD
jgi:hypothetical protein